MKLSTALRLGRVSNLPTVWTNVLAGLVLSGASFTSASYLELSVAITLFYVGGMYLNDAFDAEYDARVRPERPIPSGEISLRTVYLLGFGMLGLGALLSLLCAVQNNTGSVLSGALSALALGGAIVFYDAYHKQNPLSPVVMGLCRVLVYTTAAFCMTPSPKPALWLGAGALLSYLIGLTYAAKQENLGRIGNAWPLVCLAAPLMAAGVSHDALTLGLWALLTASTGFAVALLFRRQARDIPRAVSQFIAGISLVDGLAIAASQLGCQGPQGCLLQQSCWLALAGVAGCALTLLFQRYIAGT